MRVTLMSIHIIAGALGIVTGFVAMFVAKGDAMHRKSGLAFVYAMLTMSLMGAFLSAVWRVAPATNIPIGLLTAYLVATAFTTVRAPFANARRLDAVLLPVPVGVSLLLFFFAGQAFTSATGKLHGMPPAPYIIFGAIALFGVIGDVRMMHRGGMQAMRGAPRLARHLWRMSTALLIATFSFFIGQAKVIPKPMRIFPLLMIPPLIVLAALLYWLWRVRLRRSLRGIVEMSTAQAV